MTESPAPVGTLRSRKKLVRNGCLGIVALVLGCAVLGSLVNSGDDTAGAPSTAAVVAVQQTATAVPTEVDPTVTPVPTEVPAMANDPAALLPSAVSVVPEPAAPVNVARVQAAKAANVRDEPIAEGSTIIGQVAVGDEMTLRGKTNDDGWYAVTLSSGDEGWIKASLVIAEAALIGAAPVLAEPIPAPAAPAAAVPTVSVPADNSGLNTGGRDQYNCGDFATWAEANAVYQANLPSDPNRLDANDDGSPCDSLR